VIVIAITANAISRAPRSAASSRDIPSSTWRWMFSSTTMESSTTRPIASTIARSVSVFTLNPKRYMKVKAPTSDTGIVTSGISVAGRLRRKRKITSATSTIASMIVRKTALIDSSMKREESYTTSIFMPWSVLLISATSARTACESSSGLATACLMTPMLTGGVAHVAADHALVDGRHLRAADVADAHRIARTRRGSRWRRIPRASAGPSATSTENSRWLLSIRPAGISTFWRPQRVLDVLRRHAIGRELRGIEPDAHRDLALAEDAHVGGARAASKAAA
jgi:hypothetical protein